MRRSTNVIILVLVFVLLTARAASPQNPLRPTWQRTFDQIYGAALADGANCAALTTEDSLVVVGRNGQELWRWDFRKDNRILQARDIAVSPGCDWAAFTGDSSYKYAWIAHKNGKRVALSFQSTPQGIAIDHGGKQVAIGTAGNEIRLYSADGSLRWTRPQGNITKSLEFSPDDRWVIETGWNGVLISIDGNVRWRQDLGFGGMRASQDLKAFVTWTQAGHGQIWTSVSLLSEEGTTLWTKSSAYDSQAAISPSGDRIAFRVSAPNQPESTLDPVTTLTLFNRDGTVVRQLSGEGIPLQFSADGQRLLVNRVTQIDAVDAEDHILWTIPFRDDPPSLSASPNLADILVQESNQLRWFNPR